MFEVNVHRLVTTLDPADISGSVAERGRTAGPETWANAKAGAGNPPLLDPPLLDPSQHQAVRDWAGEFGAWEDEEIAAWTDEELCALVLQYAAGDLRELQDLAPGDGCGDIDWAEAEALSEAGTCGGNLFVYTNPETGAEELWISLE